MSFKLIHLHIFISIFRTTPGQYTFSGDVVIITFAVLRGVVTDGRNFVLDFTVTEIGNNAISPNSLQALVNGGEGTDFKHPPLPDSTYDNRELSVFAFAPPNAVYTEANYNNRFIVTSTELECCCNDFVRVYRLEINGGGLGYNFAK